MTWISLFFFLFASVMPFPTAVLSEYIDFKFAVGIYWLNIFLLGAVLFIHWNYALKHKLTDESLDLPTIEKAVRNRILFA